jgi:branched-chain amino acid transport system substrate-binding protein
MKFYQNNRVKIVLSFCLVFGAGLQSKAEIGVTDTEVIIGGHTNESGPIASAGATTALAGAAYYDMINAKGGINRRKIKWIRKDSQSLAPKTVEAVRQLVEQDKVFAVVGSNGPSHIAVYKYLNDHMVPDLFFSDGSSVYFDAKNKMTFPLYYSWKSEGETSAAYVAQAKKGKKVCFLQTKDALGDEFLKGAMESFNASNAKASDADKIKFGPTLRVDRAGSQADSEVLNFKEENCDVVMTSTYGPMAPSAINYATNQGFKPLWVVSTYNVTAKFVSLLNDKTGDGIVSVAHLAREKSLAQNKKGYDDFVALMNKNHIAVSGTAAVGYVLAEVFVETLRKAGRDLTRESIIKAAESFDGWKCSLCLNPLYSSATNHRAFGPPRLVTIKQKEWKFLK